MKKICFLILISLIASCNSIKNFDQTALVEDYYSEIQKALEEIKTSTDKAKTNEQIVSLKRTFRKYQDESLDKIKLLKKDTLTDSKDEIYLAYKELSEVQSTIIPVLPFYSGKKRLKFDFEDVSSEFLDAKEIYVHQLYERAKSLMHKNESLSFRDAFSIFQEIEDIAPNYNDSYALMQESKIKGTNFILIVTTNKTEMTFPKDFEEDILDINLEDLNREWTVFHTTKDESLDYRYKINLIFDKIDFSPEQIFEKEEQIEKMISVIGDQTDGDGNFTLDESGNNASNTQSLKIKGILNTIKQSKILNLNAHLEYFDLLSNQKLERYKIDSQFIFENTFASFDADERALTEKQLLLTKGNSVLFPSNDQMLYDVAKDFKKKFKSTIKPKYFK
jgi:hypothetical protein